MFKLRTIKLFHPLLWGFFIFALLIAIIALSKFFIPTILTYKLDKEKEEKRASIENTIRYEFQLKVNKLNQIAESALEDISSIVDSAGLSIFESVLIQKVNSYKLSHINTIDIIDSNGNVIAWKGASITFDYKKIITDRSKEKYLKIISNGLKTYLTVARKVEKPKYYLLVSELIELNSPISNRFVEKVSFSDDLTQKLKTKIILKTNQYEEINLNGYNVQLTDYENNPIAEIFVLQSKLSAELEEVNSSLDDLMSILTAIASLFLGLYLIIRFKNIKGSLVENLSIVLILWLLRIIWRQLNFPANIIGGWLFDPNYYASPFILGLSSSAGELTISVIALFVSAIILFYTLLSNPLKEVSHTSGTKKLLNVLFSGVIIILCLWLFRGYAEAIRSFVFDSTIQFNNPSEIFLTSEASLIYINILMLNISLVFVALLFVWFIRAKLLLMSNKSSVILYAAIIVISFFTFVFIGQASFYISACSFLFILSIVVLAELIIRWQRNGVGHYLQLKRIMLSALALSFLLGTTVLNLRIKQKEQQEIETAAFEILRPSDSWLTYILIDGLRITANYISNQSVANNLQYAKEKNLAFVLWAKTMLGKEGYNSALVIYDHNGDEMDRFVLGMNKVEQRELLTKVFDEEENAICFYEQTGFSIEQFYGAWTTFRDTKGQLLGSVALLVSEREKNIFQTADIDLVRQYNVGIENNLSKEIAIHEYNNGKLIFSSGKKLYPEKILDEQIKGKIEKSTQNKLWIELSINGYETNTLFVKDFSEPAKILAVSVEKLDLRWELFFYLKAFLLTLLIFVLIGSLIYFILRQRFILRLGFREKLFIGFASIAIFPLIILSYYNKQIVIERVEQQIKSNLYRELKQLQDRIKVYIADEEDFRIGIDDDFCEALTAEYGIDFSVYTKSNIHASSRSELYRASLVDSRLNGNAYLAIFINGQNLFVTKEKIGYVEYYVGYAPVKLNDNIVGIIAIPTLSRQKDIEAELAQRNAYIFGMYAIIFGIALIGGILLSIKFTKPLHSLTDAARDISNGNMNVNVNIKSKDEIGDLAQMFNEMVIKLRSSMVELAKLERENAWKEMAKQVAHEIKNPLTPIKLSMQHIKQLFKDRSPDREEVLQRVTKTVIEQIDALSNIASEFSKFAKMPETKFERFNVNELLIEAINLFKEVQGINFVEKLVVEPIIILGDREQMRGVFVNIIRNAIQAIDANGTITIETLVENRKCIIKFTDTGQGISKDILSKIFMPNFSTKSEGMGLGLAIARRVIENHGGIITCNSEIGKGTTFEIQLTI